MPAAYEMREKLRPGDKLTVISNNPKHHFTPSNPWVAVDWRKRGDIEVDIARPAGEEEGRFHPVGAKRVHPDKNQIELDDGRSIDYDYLVIATGPKLAFDESRAWGRNGHTHSICHVDHAVEAEQAWQEFVKDPGPIVVGAVQGLLLRPGLRVRHDHGYRPAPAQDPRQGADDLRHRRALHRPPRPRRRRRLQGLIESVMRERHIKWICNAKTTKVEAGKMYVTEHDEDGTPKKEHVLDFKYSMMLPAFKGIDAVIGIEGLANPRGFILIDAFQRNPKFKNIYSVGVCVAIPPVEATPVPTGAPKTGYMIESMVTATVHQHPRSARRQGADHKATWNAVCLADFGDNGAAFVALPQIPPRNVNWFSKGKWVHLAKIAFEKYFMRKIKKGTSEHIFEKMVLNAMGIMKLKDKPAYGRAPRSG
jgi:sulfide:quinone oxidoreductase